MTLTMFFSHASYAFNSYYQISGHALGSCDFNGLATIRCKDPNKVFLLTVTVSSLHIPYEYGDHLI